MIQTSCFGSSFSASYLTFPDFQTYYYLDVDGYLSKVDLFHNTPLDTAPTTFEIPHIPHCSLSCDFPQCQGHPNYRNFRNRGQLFLDTACLLQYFLGLGKLFNLVWSTLQLADLAILFLLSLGP